MLDIHEYENWYEEESGDSTVKNKEKIRLLTTHATTRRRRI